MGHREITAGEEEAAATSPLPVTHSSYNSEMETDKWLPQGLLDVDKYESGGGCFSSNVTTAAILQLLLKEASTSTDTSKSMTTAAAELGVISAGSFENETLLPAVSFSTAETASMAAAVSPLFQQKMTSNRPRAVSTSASSLGTGQNGSAGAASSSRSSDLCPSDHQGAFSPLATMFLSEDYQPCRPRGLSEGASLFLAHSHTTQPVVTENRVNTTSIGGFLPPYPEPRLTAVGTAASAAPPATRHRSMTTDPLLLQFASTTTDCPRSSSEKSGTVAANSGRYQAAAHFARSSTTASESPRDDGLAVRPNEIVTDRRLTTALESVPSTTVLRPLSSSSSASSSSEVQGGEAECFCFIGKTPDASDPLTSYAWRQPILCAYQQGASRPHARRPWPLFRVRWDIGKATKLLSTETKDMTLMSPKFPTTTDLKNIWMMLTVTVPSSSSTRSLDVENTTLASTTEACVSVKFTSTSTTLVKFSVRCGAFESPVHSHYFKQSPWSAPTVIGSLQTLMRQDALEICTLLTLLCAIVVSTSAIEFYDILFCDHEDRSGTPNGVHEELPFMAQRPRSISASVADSTTQFSAPQRSATSVPWLTTALTPPSKASLDSMQRLGTHQSHPQYPTSQSFGISASGTDAVEQLRPMIDTKSCHHGSPNVAAAHPDSRAHHFLSDMHSMSVQPSCSAELLATILAVACCQTADSRELAKLLQLALSICLPSTSTDPGTRGSILFDAVRLFMNKHVRGSSSIFPEAVVVLQSLLLSKDFEWSHLLLEGQRLWVKTHVVFRPRRDTTL